MANRFDGKVAFITGGGMGLGRAFADALAKEGASVAIADIDGGRADQAAGEINAAGGKAVGIACDVGDRGSVDAAVARAVDEFGGVDILINNAARHAKHYNQPFSALTTEEIKGMFDVNVLGIVYTSLACKKSMGERGGGVVVNIASVGGYLSNTPYGVTKVAVRGLTISLANELSEDRIRVNAVAPTMTPTDGILAEFTDEEIDRSVQTRQLVRRRATLDDVSNTVLFLCSEDAAFITGETIRVTGGANMSI